MGYYLVAVLVVLQLGGKAIMKYDAVFLHPGLIWYRKPLFDILSKKHNILYVFTRPHVVKEQYSIHSGDPRSTWNNFLNIHRRYFLFAPKVLEILLKKEYSCVILPPLDKPEDFFDALLAIVVSKLIRRKKIIVWSVSWMCDERPPIYERIRTVLRSLFVQFSDFIIVSGKKSAEYFRKLGADNRKIHIAGNVSTPNCKYSLYSSRRKLPGRLTVLFVGRLIPVKGVKILLEAFKRLEDDLGGNVQLIIVGDGPEKEKYLQYSQILGIRNITFEGFIPNNRLCSYYSNADVFVLPSIRHNGKCEAWGLVLNEAMYFGIPCVTTTDVGASGDLVIDGYNGYVVKSGDVDELYLALKKLLTNPQLRSKMGENARKTARFVFTYERMAAVFSQVINLASSSRQGS